jgi:hypothetical protein
MKMATEIRQRLEGHSPAPAIGRGAGWVAEVWARPRVRVAIVGVVLLALGVLKVTDSTWTVPLIVVGIVMVVIAWVGSRLDGRFAIQWGEDGTEFEMRARLRPHPEPPPRALAPAAPAATVAAHARAQLEVIEGDAHTVEMRVAELKELIAAAQAADAAGHVDHASGPAPATAAAASAAKPMAPAPAAKPMPPSAVKPPADDEQPQSSAAAAR